MCVRCIKLDERKKFVCQTYEKYIYFSSGKLQDLHHSSETRDRGPEASYGGDAHQGGGGEEGE